jgi:Icc-related predicted phosphoesterase
MKLHIASDLHAEFYGREGWDAVMASFSGEADVLVLAGDIVPLRFVDQVRDTLGPFCERYEHVVYVPGNHEFYGSNPTDCGHVLSAVENELSNLVWLKNGVREVKGQKFYGGTMWFQDLPTNWKHKMELNDFHLIKRLEPWVYNAERAFREGFRKHVDRTTVVVSHHLPSMGSCHPRYRQYGMDSLNAFFVNYMDQEISDHQPKLWIHGHTHEPCDWQAGDTRVICNPYGYPHEIAVEKNPVVVEI